MQENHNSGETMSKRSPCYGMCGGKSSRVFWGIVFIVVGLFWLGKEATWFSPELMKLFWPLVFVLAGTWFIAAALINKKAPH
jgi:hypothetical protein